MAKSIATNTLLLPNIPSSFFIGDQALPPLRSECEHYGQVHQFIPMKGFGRVMVIYVDTTCAIAAKEALDESIMWWDESPDNGARLLGLGTQCTHPGAKMVLRCYFGQHNPICPDPATLTLQVPDLGRNLLISPPGDPCHHWESRAESPPNKAILASDLLRALTIDDDSAIDDFCLDEEPIVQPLPTEQDTSTLQLCFQDNLPTIKIEDMDGLLLTQHQQKTHRPKPAATARPPIRT